MRREERQERDEREEELEDKEEEMEEKCQNVHRNKTTLSTTVQTNNQVRSNIISQKVEFIHGFRKNGKDLFVIDFIDCHQVEGWGEERRRWGISASIVLASWLVLGLSGYFRSLHCVFWISISFDIIDD